MAKRTAGILLFREAPGGLEVLLVHPGGPFWTKKDEGAWTIPKGLVDTGEDLLACARREFCEETGSEIDGEFLPLKAIQQKGGKIVHAWAVEAEIDADEIRSNTFEMEWPPRSGRRDQFPEVDRAAYLDVPTARSKINPAQVALLDELEGKLRDI